jgi:hypothetical protein
VALGEILAVLILLGLAGGLLTGVGALIARGLDRARGDRPDPDRCPAHPSQYNGVQGRCIEDRGHSGLHTYEARGYSRKRT